ncbi:phage tail tape measure protein [Methylocystis echinoides]|uniref:phage tail tape measure protein n=1 Tax=Methylocystis echinoides TaxID=29468 RepID=UPI003428B589
MGIDFPDFDGLSASRPIATQELTSAKHLLDQIGASGEKVAKILANGFGAAATSGKSFNETLLSIGQSLTKLALRDGAKAMVDGVSNSLSGMLSNAFSGNQRITPFAEGGVVASPAYFSNGGAIGLMGERGAEAIMPLARGPDGRLGVVAQGAQGRPVSVTVNIAAQDFESFRRSEAQITSALARAVGRGQRQL